MTIVLSLTIEKGNKPPMALAAKSAYSPYDIKRAQKYFGLRFKVPDFFPFLSLLVRMPCDPMLCVPFPLAQRE
jgi:2-hydroxychromene-2-carboxylate isomerase